MEMICVCMVLLDALVGFSAGAIPTNIFSSCWIYLLGLHGFIFTAYFICLIFSVRDVIKALDENDSTSIIMKRLDRNQMTFKK